MLIKTPYNVGLSPASGPEACRGVTAAVSHYPVCKLAICQYIYTVGQSQEGWKLSKRAKPSLNLIRFEQLRGWLDPVSQAPETSPNF